MTPTFRCGHRRIAANSQRIGKVGLRCKQCRQRIVRESMRRKNLFYDRHPEGTAPFPNKRRAEA